MLIEILAENKKIAKFGNPFGSKVLQMNSLLYSASFLRLAIINPLNSCLNLGGYYIAIFVSYSLSLRFFDFTAPIIPKLEIAKPNAAIKPLCLLPVCGKVLLVGS